LLADGCNLETINGRLWPAEAPKVTASEEVVLEGWAVDPRAHNVPLHLRLRFVTGADGPVDVPVRHRTLRPDLMAVWKTDAYLIAGFTVTVPPQTLGSGIWRVSLVYRADAKEFLCDNGRTLDVIHARQPQ